jgi:hypothetical protein
VKDAKIEDVLKEICRQSKNPVPTIQSRSEKCDHVTLELKEVSFWDAMDALEQAAGVLYSLDYQSQWLVFAENGAEEVAEAPGINCGPVSVKVTHVGANRNVYFRNPHARGNQQYVNVGVQCFWEARLPVLNGVPVITKAVTDDGVELPVPDTNFARYQGFMGNNMGMNSIGFQQVPGEVGRRLTLEGVARMRFGVGPKEIRFEDVLAPAKKAEDGKADEAKGDPKEADVMSIRTDELKMTLKDPVRAADHFQVTVDGEGTQDCPPMRSSSTVYGLFLEDAKGGRTPGQLQFSSTSSGPNGFSFQGNWIFNVQVGEGKYALVFVHPQKIITKDYPFILRNVPMP